MKKHISFKIGFIRFKNRIEISWSIYEWALPFSFELSGYLLFFRVLCFSIIIPKNLPA